MPANGILEEVWRTKDRLAREAGGDLDTYCEQLRVWAEQHPMPGPVVRSPGELRRLVEDGESS
jgi:hypothetical protein